jgi:hypothetical protein
MSSVSNNILSIIADTLQVPRPIEFNIKRGGILKFLV